MRAPCHARYRQAYARSHIRTLGTGNIWTRLTGTGCVGAWWGAHARHGHLDTGPVRCLHCQGKGHMSCAHVFDLRNCDAYSSTCHGPTSCHSHLQSRARQRASGAVRPEAAMRAALLVRGLRRAVLCIVQECRGHSVRPFHTTCIRPFVIFCIKCITISK